MSPGATSRRRRATRIQLYAEFKKRAAALTEGDVFGADALAADIAASELTPAAFEVMASIIGNGAKLDKKKIAEQLQAGRRARQGFANGESDDAHQLASLPDPPTASVPMSLAVTLDRVVQVVEHRVSCATEAAWAVSLWIAATWGVRGPDELDGPDLFPRLVIRSATKRCGKTLLLEVVLFLSATPFSAENATPAVVFRLTEVLHPTWVIDEADRFLRKNDELQGVVNSGYRRNGSVARTVEVVGRDDGGRPQRTFEARRFSTFAAMAIAGIGRLLDTIEDRGIRVTLKRQPAPRRRSKRIRLRELGQLRTFIGGSLRARGNAMAAAMAARCNDDDFPEWLNDRDADNWEPLIAVAGLAGAPWPGRAQAAMRALCEGAEAAAEQSEGERLLADIFEFAREQRLAAAIEFLKWRKTGRKPFISLRSPPPPRRGARPPGRPVRCDFIASDRLAEWLRDRDDSPVAATRDVRAAKLMVATMLRPFGIKPGQRWRGKLPLRGYELAQFKHVWRSYGVGRRTDSDDHTDNEGQDEGNREPIPPPNCQVRSVGRYVARKAYELLAFFATDPASRRCLVRGGRYAKKPRFCAGFRASIPTYRSFWAVDRDYSSLPGCGRGERISSATTVGE